MADSYEKRLKEAHKRDLKEFSEKEHYRKERKRVQARLMELDGLIGQEADHHLQSELTAIQKEVQAAFDAASAARKEGK